MSLFQTREYQEIFAKHFCHSEDIIWTDYGGFELVGEKAVFLGMKPVLGKEEVTDYGDIVAEDYQKAWQEIRQMIKKPLQLDYVRQDSPTYALFKEKAEPLEVSPYLNLPSSWDEYLKGLKRKQRKELKRKINKLSGEPVYYECPDTISRADFDQFIRLHRLSDEKKQKFMSQPMAEFFWDLTQMKALGWQPHLCFLKLKEKPVAALFSFVSDQEFWAYNSGYDPEYKDYSVGVILFGHTIKKAIEEKLKKYDFLRGGERYKYDLGADDLKLFRCQL